MKEIRRRYNGWKKTTHKSSHCNIRYLTEEIAQSSSPDYEEKNYCMEKMEEFLSPDYRIGRAFNSVMEGICYEIQYKLSDRFGGDWRMAGFFKYHKVHQADSIFIEVEVITELTQTKALCKKLEQLNLEDQQPSVTLRTRIYH